LAAPRGQQLFTAPPVGIVPHFSQTFELTLHRACELASAHDHRILTLEHLLSALIDDTDAAGVMRACGADVELLRRRVTDFIGGRLHSATMDGSAGSAANLQRVVHRAIVHVRSTGREEVTGANVLIAFFAERDCAAAKILKEFKMTCFDAVQYVSHGIVKRPATPRRFNKRLAEDLEPVPG
jgi:ATP-dependent Clp protease ATP-binding subunit ClpA